MAARVRLWRWRKNPLRRRADVLEGWLRIGAALVIAIGGTAAGSAAGAAVHGELNSGHDDRLRTSAVVLEDVKSSAPLPEAGGMTRDRVPAEVRWHAPDGAVHTGTARVDTGLEAGAKTVIWTDPQGERPVAPPPLPAEAATQAVLTGMGVAGVVGAAVLGVAYAGQRRLDRRREADWERDWERVEPRWRQGSSGPSER